MNCRPALISVILLFSLCFGAEAMPGTYKGDRILTSFGPDSLEVDGEMRYFDFDSLFFRIMKEGYTPEVQNINVHYLVDIVDHMPYGDQLRQIGRFREAGRRYNSKQLTYEADFMEIWYFPATNDSLFRVQAGMMDRMIDRMHKKGETEFEIRCREFICNIYWIRGEYARPFKEFPVIDKLLDGITDVNETGVNAASKKKFYYWFGRCYYLFRDFDKAVYYFKKATVDEAEYLYAPYHLYDETNLMARLWLGRHYRNTGDIGMSDFYFRSSLESPDSLKRRDLYDAIATCGLGRNMQLKGDYPQALEMMGEAIGTVEKYEKYSFATEVAVSMGECYLAMGDMVRTLEMIRLAEKYISEIGDDDDHLSLSFAFSGDKIHVADLYRLAGKYYALMNDAGLAITYMDSATSYEREIADRYNSMVILRAEQELFAAEKEELELREKMYTARFIYSSVAALLVLLLLIVFVCLYRQKRTAYRKLVQQSQLWANADNGISSIDAAVPGLEVCEDTISSEQHISGDGDKVTDKATVELAHECRQLMAAEKLYKDPDFTLDQLAARLNTNRVAISRAINSSGMNFNAFINEYRVKEAIRIMSAKGSANLTIDHIAYDSGFNDRKSFYRVFKKVTGISPSDFRKNIRT